jgi:hypothetical protein
MHAVRVEQQDRTVRAVAQQRLCTAAYFVEQFRQGVLRVISRSTLRSEASICSARPDE